MTSRWFAFKVLSLFSFILCSLAFGDDIPKNVDFSTRALLPLSIEGLTMDATGNFYTTGRTPAGPQKCPVWRISPNGSTRVTVAFIPAGCGAAGITFDSLGNLYIADSASGGVVRKVTPDPVGCAFDDSTNPLCSGIPNSTDYATGVPGTNGLAFDRDDNLWTGDGVTGIGRVWKIAPGGGTCEPSFNGCVEAFRIQAMANDINPPVSGVANVGSDRRSLPGGTINSARMATNTGNSQPLVANGVAFNQAGDLFVADTARGAIWKVQFDSKGNIKSPMGTCDTTFSANTLCLSNVLVQHPLLEGADGIALDQKGNIWADANERNAVVVVSNNGQVIEVFRNPAQSSLRNSGPLEFPTSPFLLGKQFCTANSDGNRRDNSPNTAGEIKPTGPLGKISCMDQELKVPGLPLPVH
jgi:sugar lactone lactonase YvrE